MKIRIVMEDDSNVVSAILDSTPGDGGMPEESGSSGGDSSSSDIVGVPLPLSTATDATIAESRPILTTPLDNYTVTEGLILIAVIFTAIGAVVSIFRGR